MRITAEKPRNHICVHGFRWFCGFAGFRKRAFRGSLRLYGGFIWGFAGLMRVVS